MKTILKDGTRVILGNVRLSYAHIFEPKAFEGAEPKYSVSLLISKDDTHTVDIVKKAIANATDAGKDKFGTKFKLKTQPLRDGDEERPDDEAYQNCYFINANSKQPPQVVGKTKDPNTGKAIKLTEDEVYSGAYANVSVNFYPYNVTANSGIAAGLGNIQKEADGERLAGGASAEDEFDFVEQEEDLDDLFN